VSSSEEGMRPKAEAKEVSFSSGTSSASFFSFFCESSVKVPDVCLLIGFLKFFLMYPAISFVT